MARQSDTSLVSLTLLLNSAAIPASMPDRTRLFHIFFTQATYMGTQYFTND